MKFHLIFILVIRNSRQQQFIQSTFRCTHEVYSIEGASVPYPLDDALFSHMRVCLLTVMILKHT